MRGVNILQVPPRNAERLGQAILDLLQDRAVRERMGRGAAIGSRLTSSLTRPLTAWKPSWKRSWEAKRRIWKGMNFIPEGTDERILGERMEPAGG